MKKFEIEMRKFGSGGGVQVVTRLAEAAVAVGLVDADAVDAGRRVAAGQLLLAVQSDVAGGAAAVRPLVVGDHATAAVVAHQTVALYPVLTGPLEYQT